MSLYEKNHARIVAFSGPTAKCAVEDAGRTYLVHIEVDRTNLKLVCPCRSSSSTGSNCRHVIAAAHALRDYIRDVAIKDWRYQLELALQKTPRSRKKKKGTKHALLFVLLQIKKGNETPFYSGMLFPRCVFTSQWPAAKTVTESDDPAQAARELLATRDDWYSQVVPYKPNEPIRAVNLSFEAQAVIDLAVAQGTGYSWSWSYYNSFSHGLPLTHLPLLARLHIPIFLQKGRKFIPLHVHPEAIPLQSLLREKDNSYVLEAGLQVEDKAFTLSRGKLKILAEGSSSWALAGDTLVPVENPEVLPLLSAFPLRIPREEAEAFREHYFARIEKHMPVVGEIIKWDIVRETPVPRLYLRKTEEDTLEAELRFGYGEYELVSQGKKQVHEEVVPVPGQWGGVRVIRDVEAELRWYQMLTDPRFGLKRAGAKRPGIFLLRARTHPLDFLMKSIPALTRAGFEIYGEKDIAKIRRQRPTLSLNISSGIDWFDVQVVVHYGEQQVSLTDIRRALKRGERYVKLADGSIGQIPEEWLEKYKHVFNLTEETPEGLRVRTTQLPLLDELLAEAEAKQIASEFHARREALRSFERITKHPLPRGFVGELRPYQRAGYDWLHFLHQYGFGGILADDMGLGKTVQALAFLQSLKERGELQRPVLLVVPKSLLVNWQRETERFTPELRVLLLVGQGRPKDTSRFEGFDIVLTTYGTMLRDIKLLRRYRFTYVILDESQAIKNPLAKTSKAARLLQAEHRLCLTGTPVENNVYELWSQFAFLNPGLLGSLDYFKREFASVIERRDEASSATVETLRKLIYPFILRRTKEQVAPELPPRTERRIYTDLNPTQRSLYHRTREYYRNLLLGLLEESAEIRDVRFKILEGLLRLRQIAIHPCLVEPAFRGPSAKFEALLETLETLQAEGHKALVFSQFVQALRLLRKELDARGIPYAYLDGQTRHRQKEVDRFQNDPEVPLFLISLKAGGLGLNLTAADYVLHLDPWWNPAVEMQATDRAHRIGQDKPVFVYKFIARDTVEEKILQLQERKRELVEQLISAEGSFFKALTKEDVRVLFS